MAFATEEQIDRRFANVSRSKTFTNIVKTLNLDTKSVLDIGCSYGEFLPHFGEGSTGVTLVQEEVDVGIARGLDIQYGNIESPEFSLEKKYDAIFANNIFEHLYSPHQFLRNIGQYLKSDGILILGVPCIPKISFLLVHKKFRGSLAVAHINFFTKETLEWTARRGGWKPFMNRGFRLKNIFLDSLLDLIYPHFYVVAHADKDFAYSKKRMKELAGYPDVSV